MTVAGVLLAAGAGTRLGRPKALIELDGQTLVERGARTLVAAECDPVVVVGGAWASASPGFVLHGADLIVNDRAATGQASSLAAGLAALAHGPAHAVVIALVDQPFVSSTAIRRLIAAYDWARLPAVVATYGGLPRNPVVLDRTVWDAVLAAAGPDEGARAWLRTHQGHVLEVPCDDVASPTDVDTPNDLLAATAEHPAWS